MLESKLTRKATAYPLLILMVGAIVILTAFEYVTSKNRQQLQQQVQFKSDTLKQQMEASLNRRFLQVASIANLFSSADWVSLNSFNRMVSQVFTTHRDLQQISYLLHTNSQDVAAVEAKIRDNNHAEYRQFEIFDFDYQTRTPKPLANDQEHIIALLYNYPQRNIDHFIGRSIGKVRPVYQYAMSAYQQQSVYLSGLSEPLPAIPHPHFFIAHPVQDSRTKDGKIIGFVMAGNVLKDVFRQLSSEELIRNFDLYLLDDNNNRYHLNSDSMEQHQESWLRADDIVHPISVNDGHWQLLLRPQSHAQAPNNQSVMINMVSLGLFFIGLAMLVRTSLLQQAGLTDLINEKTAELTLKNEHLAKANRLAEQAATAKSDFLANMSHEIRTPMNGLIGMTDLLRETQLDHNQASYIEKITYSAKHLLSIINDILDFSKIESGKLNIEAAPFSINTVVGFLQDTFALQAREKGIDFEVHLESAIRPDLVGDIVRINQILLNLCSNAIKFTPKGKVQVSISATTLPKTSEDEGSLSERYRFEFAVQDTGIGIPAEKLDSLFDLFTQADASTTRKYGGTGLGLAISKRLCQQMGGDISVSSQPGTGSTFCAQIEVSLNDKIVTADSSKQRLSKAFHLLVLDDNPLALLSLRQSLTARGAKVITASHGMEALKILNTSSHNIDAIILDWTMPQMGGYQFLNFAVQKFAAVPPVLILSAYNIGHIRKESAKFSIHRFLQKPCDLGQLLEAIESTTHDTPKNPVEVAPPDFANVRILVAEDNEINQIIIKELLYNAGAEVVLTGNGRQTIETLAASDEPFDLILMDINMPILDGVSATKAIRTSDRAYARIPIIALTANVLESDVSHYFDVGMNGHASKPIIKEHLFQQIHDLLQQRK